MCKVIQIVIRIFEEENGVQEDYQKMRIHICLLIIVFFIRRNDDYLKKHSIYLMFTY